MKDIKVLVPVYDKLGNLVCLKLRESNFAIWAKVVPEWFENDNK